jgi:hypothetical protein
MINIPGMKANVNWSIRNSTPCEHNISGCSIREDKEERLRTAAYDLKFIPQEAKMVLNDVSNFLF